MEYNVFDPLNLEVQKKKRIDLKTPENIINGIFQVVGGQNPIHNKPLIAERYKRLIYDTQMLAINMLRTVKHELLSMEAMTFCASVLGNEI